MGAPARPARDVGTLHGPALDANALQLLHHDLRTPAGARECRANARRGGSDRQMAGRVPEDAIDLLAGEPLHAPNPRRQDHEPGRL
eukprot:6062371-Alexandrium_andersonii.AAC.1